MNIDPDEIVKVYGKSEKSIPENQGNLVRGSFFGIGSALMAASLMGLGSYYIDEASEITRRMFEPYPKTKAQIKARDLIKKRRANDKKNRKGKR